MVLDATTKKLPLILTECLKFLPGFVGSRWFRFARSGDRVRALRSDHAENLTKVLSVLVRSCSLQHEGIICHIDQNWSRPMSVPEIAALAEVSVTTAFRCLADLKDMKLIESRQIKRNNRVSGLLEVSIGIRRFTPLFWEKIGLADLFKRSCGWAKSHAKRRLFMPFKIIRQKVEKTFSEAKDVAKSVLGNLMSDANAQRVKQNCDKILQMLRQRK